MFLLIQISLYWIDPSTFSFEFEIKFYIEISKFWIFDILVSKPWHHLLKLSSSTEKLLAAKSSWVIILESKFNKLSFN